MNADILEMCPSDPRRVDQWHSPKKVKPWSILKSKYRFIPWYEKDAA